MAPRPPNLPARRPGRRRRGVIDWDLAVATGQSLVRPGPVVSADEATDAVMGLRASAELSRSVVSAYTGLHADPSRTPVLVVDRPSWVRAAAEGFQVLAEPLEERLAKAKGMTPWARAVGSRVTGLEVGGLLAFMSGKVLGQFDPFAAAGGRLLLVAPNIVQAERELDAVPGDFRTWVCLHEETHRLQFGAVPWLGAHLRAQVSELAETTDLELADVTRVVDQGLTLLGRIIRGDSEASLLDLVQSPAQKEVVERITAVMSLLEGHADVVMDGVGPQVVPSVDTLRKRFTQRRRGAGPVDKLVRRLLGLDAKMRQYRDGAAFCRGVVDRVGSDGFHAVWAAPDNLPRPDEIADPARWCDRVVA
ncbi:MAG: zinc-dependent metalloprotease [Nocardioidaceae bacterium]|nr:zinc-dependent metalloprotease [Nocardioidaceae bacterium]